MTPKCIIILRIVRIQVNRMQRGVNVSKGHSKSVIVTYDNFVEGVLLADSK